MGTELLSEKYAAVMDGTLNCFDRVVLTGSLQPLCYAQGMTSYLYGQGIRIFDYAQFSQPLHEQMVAHAETVAKANGLEIEYIRKKDFRKEDRIQKILKQRGNSPGWCTSFRLWSPALPTDPGTTRALAGLICCGTVANACTITSISSLHNSDFVICVCQPGVPSGCSSTSTGMPGWLFN